jgi:hypothetical protein
VWAHGRDATTGLFYQQLVTSGDPGHDALGQGAPTPDALLTDVQAGAVLGLARAQDLASSLQALDAGADGSVGAPPPYWGQATTIVQALATTGMFDGTITPPAPHTPGAFMEAFIPATAAMDQNKTTLGNAWLLGGFHRVASGMVSQLSDVVLGQLRAALIQQKPANSSLYSVVTNASGSGSIQTAYLRASSKDFHYALLFSPDGGTGSQEPAATSYRSDAVAAMVEGFTQLWIGRASPPQCSP